MIRNYLVKSRLFQSELLFIQLLSAVIADSSSMAENSTNFPEQSPTTAAKNEITGKIVRQALKSVLFAIHFCTNCNLKISIQLSRIDFVSSKQTSKRFNRTSSTRQGSWDRAEVRAWEKRICIHKLFDFVIQFVWFIELLKHMIINITRFIAGTCDDLRYELEFHDKFIHFSIKINRIEMIYQVQRKIASTKWEFPFRTFLNWRDTCRPFDLFRLSFKCCFIVYLADLKV